MAKRKKLDVMESIDRMIGNDPKLRAMIEEEKLNAEIARMVYDARVAAGLTQAQLAKLIKSSQPAIARLEDADYRGHSLSMLRKIAAALNQRLEVRLVPVKRRGKAA